MKPLSDFEGKTALVTGASSGIGAATAVAFGAAGADVLVHYNNEECGARAVVDAIVVAGARAALVRADLSTRSGTHNLVRALDNQPIDILINNAGSLVERTRVADFSEDLWDRVVELNFSSAFFVSKAVLQGMVQRRRGWIVNVSSLAALTGGGLGALAYASCKGAISTMTKALAREFAPHGIRVNAVSPGTIDTNYHRKFSTSEAMDAVRAATPAGRLGTSQEVADVILFLCSKGSQFIHGQVIEVNGGFAM